MPTDTRFADYCCELLATAGPCRARRMFGGWGISVDGLTIAIIGDFGAGERLYLKADDASRASFEKAGCEQAVYEMKGVPRPMNYYTAPEDAMESTQLMAPWARQALECALRAHASKARPRGATKSQARPPSPATKRTKAPAPKASASRKSAKG